MVDSVCLKTTGKAECHILNPGDTVVAPAASSPFFFANASAKGYYRSSYTSDQLKAITAKAESALTAPERIDLIGDQWALIRGGNGAIGGFLIWALP